MQKNTLIIGASGDIGIAVAKERVKQGEQVILHFHSNKKIIMELAKEIASEQVLQVVQADLSRNDGVEKLLTEIVFPVNQIVFASGKADFGLFQDASTQLIEDMLTLHVKAPWLITRHYLPEMIKNQSGKIIFITSIWGEVGASNEVIYSSVKGAQNSFAKALAKEVAASNISVNAVSPGFIDTKMNLSLSAEEKHEIYRNIPLGRPGFPQEVAEAVSFLLRPENKMNGQILQVSGGWML